MSMNEGFNQQAAPAQTGEIIIRPHHTAIIAGLLRGELGLDEIADITQTNAYTQANTFGQNHPRRQEYRDRYGDEAPSADTFNASMTAFIKEFIELPDSAPVKAAPELDAICQGCFIGDHCDTTIKIDASFTRAIRSTARVLGISELVAESQEEVTLRNGNTILASVQRMGAGTARRIFADDRYELRTARTGIGIATGIAMRGLSNIVAKGVRLAEPKRQVDY